MTETTSFIQFNPIIKPTIWGGNKIKTLKNIDTNCDNIGESWEISGVFKEETIACNGPWRGRALNSIVKEMKDLLVGKSNYQQFKDTFPLLIKFIDTNKDLSIQVHPDTPTAIKHGYDGGKAEMWYIINAQSKARVWAGFKNKITPQEYLNMIKNETICDAIASYNVDQGDCFYIPPGTIHCIGAGCLLAEIQQTSTLTYRIYDFNRRDLDGNLRQLHTDKAREAINFETIYNCKQLYKQSKNMPNTLVDTPYFTTKLYQIDRQTVLDYTTLDSFVILIGTKGSGVLTDTCQQQISFGMGNVILLPATTTNITVTGEVDFLETYIQL